MAAHPPVHEQREFSEKTLLIFLKREITLSLCDSFPPETFCVKGDTFASTAGGRWQGFYDWLRDTPDHLIGVRYWLFEDADVLLRGLPDVPYVSRNEQDHTVEMYFSSSRDYQDDLSADQDFGYQGFFLTPDGTLAVALDVSMLNEAELRSLEQYEADWITLTPA